MRTTCIDCGRLTEMDSSGRGHRCRECARVHRALLDHPLTSAPWRRRRARFLTVRLATDPTCDHCGADVSKPGQADVQHRTPRRDLLAGLTGMGSDPARARVLGTAALRAAGRTAAAQVSDSDLELLCKSCHGKVTRAEAMHGGVGSDRELDEIAPRRPGSPREKPPFASKIAEKPRENREILVA